MARGDRSIVDRGGQLSGSLDIRVTLDVVVAFESNGRKSHHLKVVTKEIILEI